jgi:hypothetical protein
MITNESVSSSYLSPIPEPETAQDSAGPQDPDHTLTIGTKRQDASVDATFNTVQNSLLICKAPPKKALGAIVIDCSAISFVDVVGTANLLHLAKDCKKKNIRLILAGCAGQCFFQIRTF